MQTIEYVELYFCRIHIYAYICIKTTNKVKLKQENKISLGFPVQECYMDGISFLCEEMQSFPVLTGETVFLNEQILAKGIEST